ncbi:MAG: PDZ domain-containing protein [Planctomycetota bacterium]|jgi:hypothetical protein
MHTRLLVVLACLAALGVRISAFTDAQDSTASVELETVIKTEAEKPSTIPDAAADLEWLNDIDEALKLAVKQNRPVFATLRCVPCKQCTWIENKVMKPSAAMTSKQKQFICVRVTTMRNIDNRLWKFTEYQDLDCSWWAYFFSPKGQIYGVYGGIDITGDQSRMSEAGLLDAMDNVLNHHYQPDREAWNVDGIAPNKKIKAETPNRLKGWDMLLKKKSWFKKEQDHASKAIKNGDDPGCLHCHTVGEVVRQPKLEKNGFNKETDFFDWPYAENIGLKMNKDENLTVKMVINDTAADDVRILQGDKIRAANGQLVFSNTDLRRVLHSMPFKACELTLSFLRKGEVQSETLKLQDNWRKHELGWRKSVAEAPIGASTGFGWPIGVNGNQRKKLGIRNGELAFKPYWGKNGNPVAAKHGLTRGDVVIAINGEKPNKIGRDLNAWFRIKFEPDDDIELTVVNGKGKQRKIKYKAPGNN